MLNGGHPSDANNNITLHLTQEEDRLFQTLESAASAYESGLIQLPPDLQLAANTRKQSIEIRIAGGWVRDKILQHESHDVDVALNCMTGRAFATLVQIYMLSLPSSSATTSQGPKIAVISANPAQSKHLETATMKLYGMDIDFVNLRAEEIYQPDSRIPTTQFGTPKEDALRRDFTVNSLFYNIRTRAIEDWTGRGLQDLLLDKMLVTPLLAHVTFLDDPLRVLRAIRFSVRYNLKLHPDITEAARSDQVHEALHLKVSRERVGKELDDMLVGKGAKPGEALSLLTQLKLAGSVFCFPHEDQQLFGIRGLVMGIEYRELNSIEDKARAREMAWLESTKLIQILPHVLQCFQTNMTNNLSHELLNEDTKSEADERIIYLSVFLSPLRNLTYFDKKKKENSLITYIVRESIKFKNKDITDVTTVLGNMHEMESLIVRFKNHHYDNDGCIALTSDLRLELGLLLRKVKDVWVTLLVVSLTLLVRKCDSGAHSDHQSITFIELCCHLYHSIVNNGLDRCWTIRPLIDGRDLITLLGISAGPQVQSFLDEQVKWMLLHPDGKREECEWYLKEMNAGQEQL
jgi:tRNA nucleotidyltransferase (CCA-adding enzyme)